MSIKVIGSALAHNARFPMLRDVRMGAHEFKTAFH